MKASTFALATAITITSCATSPAFASTEECVELGNLGRLITEARDVGIPLDQLLPDASGDSGIEMLMVAVYDSGVTPDETSTILIVQCMKGSWRVSQ